MFKLIQLITFRSDASDASRSALASALDASVCDNPHIARARLAPAGLYVVNGGDLHWHIQFRNEDDYLAWRQSPAGHIIHDAQAAQTVRKVDAVGYQQQSIGLAEPDLRGGIHRTLLLAMRPDTLPAKIDQFEAEMRQMARYVPAIRNWGLSRVIHAEGARRWTHVWEQEFRNEADLNGPYMMHPIHFASIDRWFDSQSHDWIVEPLLCHSYCAMTESMIAPPSR